MALARYTSGPASYVERALHEPTARSVAEHVLNGAVNATTNPDGPADPAILTRYIATFAYGISVQPATGAAREALSQIVGTALAGWPTDLARLHPMHPLLPGPGRCKGQYR